MKNLSKSNISLFVILYFAFSLAFMFYWNSKMTEHGNTSNQLLMTTIIFLESYCMYVYLSNLKKKVHGIHIVCLLWIVLMPIIMLINHASITHFFQTILWPLLFETSYFLCLHNRANIRNLHNLFIPIALIGLALFLLTRIGIEKQTNTIYFILLTLPWLLYNQKTDKTYLLLFVFVLLSFLSLKRSAIFSLLLTWMFFFIAKFKGYKNYFYVVTTIVFAVVIVSQLYDRVDEKLGGMLSERVGQEEAEGEGRSGIYEYTLFMIQSSTPRDLVLGHGHFGVQKDSFYKMSAHNDFLEVIYDYGVIILILYLCLWGHVVRQCYRLYRARSSLFLPYATTLSIFLVMSMVSHLILYTSYFNHLVLLWGCTEAYCESHKYLKGKFKQKKLEYKNENRYTYIP